MVASATLVGLVLAIWFVYHRRHGRMPSPPRLAMSPSGEVIPIDRWLDERGLNADHREENPQDDDERPGGGYLDGR